MLARHVTYEQECLGCKVVSGFAFGGFGAFNVWRTKSMWSYMGAKDKMFNLGAVSFIFGISALNFAYAYRIYCGQKMELVELRPSYTSRFNESYRLMMMSDEDKRAYLLDRLEIEEEKAEVQ